MKKINSVLRLMTALFFAVVLVACTTAPPTIQTGPDAELSFDGLHMVDNSQADVAWARPDFDISGYTKIWLVGAGIEYRQVKNRGRTSVDRTRGGPYFIDDKSRAQFEELVGTVFREELEKIEKYELVDGPGPDVLMVRGGLLDVTSYVPPDPVGGRSVVFLSSVGEATLVLELRDSETGTILARSVDRRAAETIGGTFTR
ncbi:MAG: DUF3313 family protein, partial [Planctomycetota bacterium]